MGDENRANRRLDDDACLSRNFSIYFVLVSTTRVPLTFTYLSFAFDETHFPVSRRRISFHSLRLPQKKEKNKKNIFKLPRDKEKHGNGFPFSWELLLTTSVKPSLVLGRRSTGVLGTIPSSRTQLRNVRERERGD